MKPLIVLLSTFVLSLLVTRLVTGQINYPLSGTIAMVAMLLLTAIGHFLFQQGMEVMLPAFVPFKKAIVLITGILEIVAAFCLLVPAIRHQTAWLLIAFFIMILPANISAATRKINYQKGTADGPGINSLWLRIPLQILFIGWVYFFCIWK